jgi:hypothetical protein
MGALVMLYVALLIWEGCGDYHKPNQDKKAEAIEFWKDSKDD